MPNSEPMCDESCPYHISIPSLKPGKNYATSENNFDDRNIFITINKNSSQHQMYTSYAQRDSVELGSKLARRMPGMRLLQVEH